MRIVTNPGSNLSASAIARYGIKLAPQRIVVDGVEHDTRQPLSFAEVDRWVATAREHPYVIGTSAQEMSRLFQEVAREDPEVLAIMTSRKIIQSYAAATAAARTVRSSSAFAEASIAVVDTGVTDVGAGLFAILAGEAARAGLGVRRTAELLEGVAADVRFAFIPQTLDWLVKGGRASFLRAWLANVLGVLPLIGFDRGELKSFAKVPAKRDPAAALAEYLGRERGRRRVWLAVVHGNAPDLARGAVAAITKEVDAAYVLVRPLASSIYLHMGPGMVGACVLPIDRLPWTPTTPPDLSE